LSKAPARPGTTEASIDSYLAALPDDQRGALEKLRQTLRAAVPRAEECISYGLPAFRLDGKVLVYFGASASGCAFYPGSGTAVAAHGQELKGYTTGKGSIRFEPARPLPAALVRRIVTYRVAENAARHQHTARGTARRSPGSG
jgi:uncharacterized protein YdhG (YjbR/CyaY superfamily)